MRELLLIGVCSNHCIAVGAFIVLSAAQLEYSAGTGVPVAVAIKVIQIHAEEVISGGPGRRCHDDHRTPELPESSAG